MNPKLQTARAELGHLAMAKQHHQAAEGDECLRWQLLVAWDHSYTHRTADDRYRPGDARPWLLDMHRGKQ